MKKAVKFSPEVREHSVRMVPRTVLDGIDMLNFMRWYLHTRKSGFPAASQAA